MHKETATAVSIFVGLVAFGATAFLVEWADTHFIGFGSLPDQGGMAGIGLSPVRYA